MIPLLFTLTLQEGNTPYYKHPDLILCTTQVKFYFPKVTTSTISLEVSSDWFEGAIRFEVHRYSYYPVLRKDNVRIQLPWSVERMLTLNFPKANHIFVKITDGRVAV